MTIFTQCIILAFWLILIAFWIISALRAKKKIHGVSWWRGALLRAFLVIGVIELQRLPAFRKFSHHLLFGAASSNPAVGVIGVILCAAGMAFAVWARLHLGRNWGTPMSLQENHELVTTGPYARVRHPIYTGALLAMLGSAFAASAIWFIAFIIVCPFFIYSAIAEEKFMAQQFPNEYPAYKARTKMLVPFVW